METLKLGDDHANVINMLSDDDEGSTGAHQGMQAGTAANGDVHGGPAVGGDSGHMGCAGSAALPGGVRGGTNAYDYPGSDYEGDRGQQQQQQQQPSAHKPARLGTLFTASYPRGVAQVAAHASGSKAKPQHTPASAVRTRGATVSTAAPPASDCMAHGPSSVTRGGSVAAAAAVPLPGDTSNQAHKPMHKSRHFLYDDAGNAYPAVPAPTFLSPHARNSSRRGSHGRDWEAAAVEQEVAKLLGGPPEMPAGSDGGASDYRPGTQEHRAASASSASSGGSEDSGDDFQQPAPRSVARGGGHGNDGKAGHTTANKNAQKNAKRRARKKGQRPQDEGAPAAGAAAGGGRGSGDAGEPIELDND